MNVLILAMSTLPEKSVSKSKAIWDGEDNKRIEIEYYSQLEPVTEMLIEQGNIPDEVLIICTKEVCDKVKNFALEDEEDDKYYKERHFDDVTALSFYENRIKDYIDNKKIESDIKFTKIPQNSNEYINPYLAESKRQVVTEIAQKVVALKEKNKEENFKVWIDTQGGFRDISLLTNAVISLLRPSDIIPEEIYSLNLKDGVWYISEQKEVYKIFEFVSGMNEFTLYGRADQLVEYYNEIGAKKPEIIESMKKLAEAIQLCNVDIFDDILNILRQQIQTLSLKEVSGYDAMFLFFIEQFKMDYGSLLDVDCTKMNVVKWLWKKKFYQQALTYIESQIPKEWEKRGILNFEIMMIDNDLDVKKIPYRVMNRINSQKMGDYLYHTLIINANKEIGKKVADIIEKKDLDKLKQYVNKQKVQGKDVILNIQDTMINMKVENKIKGKKVYHYVKMHVYSKMKEDLLLIELILYKILKNERNKYNHMISKKMMKFNDLDHCINLFIEYGEKLYD